jgi:hypothetical protein
MKTSALKVVQAIAASSMNRHQKMMMAALAQNTTRKVVAIYCPNDCVEGVGCRKGMNYQVRCPGT